MQGQPFSLLPNAREIGRNLAVQRRAAGHGEHFAVEKFALRLGAPFEFEIFGFRQPLDWFRNNHDWEDSKFFARESKCAAATTDGSPQDRSESFITMELGF